MGMVQFGSRHRKIPSRCRMGKGNGKDARNWVVILFCNHKKRKQINDLLSFFAFFPCWPRTFAPPCSEQREEQGQTLRSKFAARSFRSEFVALVRCPKTRNRVGGAKKERSDRFVLFLSKPQAWYIIDARSAAYIISPCGAVSHHAPACILPAAWWYTTLRVDDIQPFGMMIYTPPAWFIKLQFRPTSSAKSESPLGGSLFVFFLCWIWGVATFCSREAWTGAKLAKQVCGEELLLRVCRSGSMSKNAQARWGSHRYRTILQPVAKSLVLQGFFVVLGQKTERKK